MVVNKKIIVSIIVLFVALASFFAYNKFIPLLKGKSTVSVVQSIEEKRKQEFTEALKQASASDQDLDGISDSDEVAVYKTDPASVDTDSDGLTDYQEIFVFKTDPLKADSDGDSFNDGYEVRRGTNPNKI